MKKSKDTAVIKTNRGTRTITMTVSYAKKTPEGFWKDVYRTLEYLGIFNNQEK